MAVVEVRNLAVQLGINGVKLPQDIRTAVEDSDEAHVQMKGQPAVKLPHKKRRKAKTE